MPTIQKNLDRKYFVRYRTCTYVDNGLIFTYNKHNEISDSRKKLITQSAFQICITVIIGVE